jgi:hypothetical protein
MPQYTPTIAQPKINKYMNKSVAAPFPYNIVSANSYQH